MRNLKPVTSRLDTQIELTKGLKDENEMANFEPPPPIDDDDDEMANFEPPPPIDDDDDEMANFEPPPPIDDDDDEMANFEPPPPIDDDDDEMANFEPPPPIDDDDDEIPKRKKWDPSPFNIANQKELDNERKDLANERRHVNVLLGKLLKSGNTQIKSGVYQGASYEELLKKSDDLMKQIDRIEDQLLMTSQKKQRMEYKKVPFSSSELQEKAKKLKRTPSKTKSKTKPIIEMLNKATRQTLGTERCLICHTHVGTIVEVEVGTAENYKMQSLRLEPEETELQRKTIQMSLQTKTYIFFGHLPASYPISMANRRK